MNYHFSTLLVLVLSLASGMHVTVRAREVKIRLTADMVVNEAERGNPDAMVDEQELIGDPPSGKPESTWKINSQFWKTFPYSAYIDLGTERNLSHLWFFDTYNHGELVVAAGEPGDWRGADPRNTRIHAVDEVAVGRNDAISANHASETELHLLGDRAVRVHAGSPSSHAGPKSGGSQGSGRA